MVTASSLKTIVGGKTLAVHGVARSAPKSACPLLAPHRRGVQERERGLITAITVMLGFNLAFVRFWSFEASGAWTARSFVAAVGLTLAFVLQIVALVRSLRLEDEEPAEYRTTVRWFVASVVVLGGALIGAAAVYAGMR